MKKLIAIIGIAVIFASCFPRTKEDYLFQYKQLVNKVKSEHRTYSDADWLPIDKRHNRINHILNTRFKNRLTTEDKIVIALYRVQYDSYRYKGTFREAVSDYLDEIQESADFLYQQGIDIFSDTLDSLLED